jgi:hypothetical protein
MTNAFEASIAPGSGWASVTPPKFLAVTQLGEQCGVVKFFPMLLHRAHLTAGRAGNCWAQTWTQRMELVRPAVSAGVHAFQHPTNAGYPVAFDNGGIMQISTSPGFQL